MHVKKLILQNFKNLNSELEFSSGINLIIGPNGIGKTNILESLHYLTYTSSFRHSSDKHLINWNSQFNFCKVKAKFDNSDLNDFEYVITNLDGKLSKKYSIDENKISRIKFSNNFPTIFFSPEDINIIAGSPDIRRRILDDFVVLMYPELNETYSDYKKVLVNRNKLLKQIRANIESDSSLKIWDSKLIELGSKIISVRIKVLNELIKNIKTLAENIFDEQLLEFNYKYLSRVVQEELSDLNRITQLFETKIFAGRDKEINAAMTLYGPQRDDIEFFYSTEHNQNVSFREFASRGQQRLISIILRIAMWKFYKEVNSLKPVILLDDIMSELDSKHSQRLEKAILEMETQTVITATSNNDFTKEFLTIANIISI